MSLNKCVLLSAVSLVLCGTVTADPIRTRATYENRFPRWEQVEAGVNFDYLDTGDSPFNAEIFSTAAYIRYGVLDNLAIMAEIPYVDISGPFGQSEAGLGDILLEVQLRAYEDILGYPYFLPHVSVTLPTGDDDKGLGEGDPVVFGGMTWGTQIRDWLGFALDVSYRVNPNDNNQLVVGNSWIWEVSNQFALLGEVTWEEKLVSVDDDLIVLTGGMVYNWTDQTQMAVHVGSAVEGELDTHLNVRFSYSF